jgi:2-isopropylmalate synthase
VSATEPAGVAGGGRVVIFDTTLCDGEQAPGVALSVSEKVEIAEQLARLGVDVVEAGFPASSQGDFDGVQAIAETVRGSSVAALCRTRLEDVDRAWQAVKSAARPRLHTFIPTSRVHREKLRTTPDQVLQETAQAVARARGRCDDVEFSAEDATRTEPEFLADVCAAAVENGAGTINISDTAGVTMPADFVEILRQVRERVPGAEGVVWSVHCHDDLGLATANSLSAIRVGARQVEVCVNGIGERAGNTPLEEVVMALRTHRPTLGLTTGIDSTEIARTSRLVAMLSGYLVPPNKAVVGANVFSRASGIHERGARMERATYEIMSPADIGLARGRIVLGKNAGRRAVADALDQLGIHLPAEPLDRAFARFTELANRKATLTDADLVALATEEAAEQSAISASVYAFQWLAVAGGTDTAPRATVRLAHDDDLIEADATGAGMIDAACNAVAKATGVDAALVSFQVAAVTPGADAVGDVSVQVDVAGQRVNARGVSTDVVEASARAFLHAINKAVGGTAVPHWADRP